MMRREPLLTQKKDTKLVQILTAKDARKQSQIHLLNTNENQIFQQIAKIYIAKDSYK